MTQSRRLAPRSLAIPDSRVFMLSHAQRTSPYATYVASIRCVVLRAPRSPVPPFFAFRRPLSVISQSYSLFPLCPAFSIFFLPQPQHSVVTLIFKLLFVSAPSLFHFTSCSAVPEACGVVGESMTGAALVGRRWADCRCRDHTVIHRRAAPPLRIFPSP